MLLNCGFGVLILYCFRRTLQRGILWKLFIGTEKQMNENVNRRVSLERCKLTLSYEIVSENCTFLKVSNHFNKKKILRT
jgi:hypothetical protein